MTKFKKIFKNDWGKFEAVLNEEHNSLYLNATYPSPNGRKEVTQYLVTPAKSHPQKSPLIVGFFVLAIRWHWID